MTYPSRLTSAVLLFALATNPAWAIKTQTITAQTISISSNQHVDMNLDNNPIPIANVPMVLAEQTRTDPSTPLGPGVASLGNLYGFNANTDDLKRAIGDLPLLENQKSFVGYGQMLQQIQIVSPAQRKSARRVSQDALDGGKFRGIPNDVRRILIRYLTFKSYGRSVLQ
ncbi:hypothetical protein [Candidatus Cyanaurora vandensis]|uniref:hypothetical protein n=1 Tax=Candidatus Cyanaurora vandensis TaxID=2714958 RepID=UPI00257C815C|nr:hypothetical protein [Candidatus Cyanaurora vandensis]